MKYRKKPVIIEAKQFTTNNELGNVTMNNICNWINQETENPIARHDGADIYIQTLEGEMKASVGDFIIQGVNGEFYPCKPDIFEKTYEIAE